MKTEPETRSVQSASKNHLRLGVGAPDAGHHPAADVDGDDVSHLQQAQPSPAA